MFPGPKSDSSDGVRLLTADGSLMVCSGTKIIPLQFSCGAGSKVYTWTFQLAPVSVPLLRADFLEHFDLLIDTKGLKVVHTQCPESVVPHASPTPQPSSVPPTSLLRPRSGNFSQNSQTCSAAMVSQPRNLTMVSPIIF